MACTNADLFYTGNYTLACMLRMVHFELGFTNRRDGKQVSTAWQNLLVKGYALQTESGQPLRVIYPGKSSEAPGSDFRDAVIKIGNRTLKGNIEVHINSSHWRKHGHHLNPAYNGVVLHVALRHDCPGDMALQNGDVLPTVAIDRYLQNDGAIPAPGRVPCAGIGEHSPDRLIRDSG